MRTTIEENKKYLQSELWTSQQSSKTNSDSLTLLNVKKETKKVEFSDRPQSTLDRGERQLDSADSIGKEMTHFKPIRLMPLSAIYISDRIIKIPPIRHTNPTKGTYFFQAPAKSKFKPENFIKSRRSAFCLVSDKRVEKQQQQQQNQKQKTSKSQEVIDPSNRRTHYNGNKSTEKIICNIALNKTVDYKKKVQENGDFALAKVLQEYDSVGYTTENNGNGHNANHSLTDDRGVGGAGEPSARTRRYYLRTRSKQISNEKDVAVPASKRVKLSDAVTAVKDRAGGGGNKVVVNGRKTRSSAPTNEDQSSKTVRLTRGRKK